MKRIFLLLVLFGLVGYVHTTKAQEERRTPRVSRGGERTPKQATEKNGLPELTVRAQNMNELLTQDIGNARWMRIIYRELDMLKEKNAPLYYPTTPANGAGNLFYTIFQLALEGRVILYKNPITGTEVFDEAHKLNLKDDLLDPYYIMYQAVPGSDGLPRYVVNESDVPADLVRTFYVKEAWFFDQNNSVYDVKTLAICPLMYITTDMGEEQRSALFWVPYEDVRPYVSNSYIMTSNLNNVRTFTIDDYFRRRMYEGEIIKTENLLNLPLQAYCPTPDSMQREQQRIETELKTFEKALWFQPDSAQLLGTANKKTTKKSVKSSGATTKKTTTTAKEKKTATPKAKAPKAERSAPTRSVRRGR